MTTLRSLQKRATFVESKREDYLTVGVGDTRDVASGSPRNSQNPGLEKRCPISKEEQPSRDQRRAYQTGSAKFKPCEAALVDP